MDEQVPCTFCFDHSVPMRIPSYKTAAPSLITDDVPKESTRRAVKDRRSKMNRGAANRGIHTVSARGSGKLFLVPLERVYRKEETVIAVQSLRTGKSTIGRELEPDVPISHLRSPIFVDHD